MGSSLAWRRADSPEARALALLLRLSNIGLDFQSQNWITPWPALDATLYSLAGPIGAGGLVLLATYAMLFARPANTLRRALAWISYAGAAASGLLVMLWPPAVSFGMPFIDGLSRIQLSDISSELSYGIPVLCFLAAIPPTRDSPETPVIARDDLGLIELKSRREAITEPEWAELGVAFPMLVRGQVRGILFCQAPADGDFAPDDVQLLQQLADRMATDRDDLLAASLRQELDTLRIEMTELRARLGAQ